MCPRCGGDDIKKMGLYFDCRSCGYSGRTSELPAVEDSYDDEDEEYEEEY
jgi:tRNA(Ile2) C34 agmatinyltransferase TiaS